MGDTYVVIKLKNHRKDFAKAWEIIGAIRTCGEIDRERWQNVCCYDAGEEIQSAGKLISAIKKNFHARKMESGNQPKPECQICLWIEDCSQNDVMDYLYLALIMQNTKGVICYIYPDSEKRIFEVYNQVSCYFSSFLQKENGRQRIWVKRRMGDKYGTELLAANLFVSSYKVIPVIEFDRVILEGWTRTVEQFLADCKEDVELWGEMPVQELQYQLQSAKKNLKNAEQSASANAAERQAKYRNEINNLNQKKENMERICRESPDDRLLCRCINYFVMDSKRRNMEEIEKYKKLWKNTEVRQLLKDTSLLAFFIFCIHMYFMKHETVIGEDEIRQLLIHAEELTEGIVQILENLHHSSEGRGLLSIRVHEKDGRKTYLSELYQDYISQEAAPFDFEFRILDYSDCSIVESFKSHNLQGGDSFPDSFGVKNFFESIDGDLFWEEYNRNPENLVHHYGLQIFSTIISNNEGRFRVVSSSGKLPDLEKEYYYNGEMEAEREPHIPGTEYDILLPMKFDVRPLNPSVDADIQYQFDMHRQFRAALFDSQGNWADIMERTAELQSGQERKEKRINCLKDSMQEWLREESGKEESEPKRRELIMVLSAEDWERSRLEILCKALVLCLIEWKPEREQGFYAIIRDCSPNDFISIVRMFAIFYSKGNLSDYMSRLQIYLSGKDQSEEFIIAGKDLSGLLTLAGKLTLVRGIQPYCMKSIEYILRRFQTKTDESAVRELSLAPFDMVEIPASTGTLFEKAVKKVLESDIQKYSFGCKVRHTHMRIGSKLHIEEFFEAELLFHNNYYVSRFSMLILRQLERELNRDTPVMFVGYETYSELLLYEIVTNLNDKGFDCSYMVYEQRKEGTFRYYNSTQYLKEKENLSFILIVPINSTMTTHSKLQSSLIQEVEKVRGKSGVCIRKQYAIILIRSGQEQNKREGMEIQYYDSVQEGVITSSFLPEGKNRIHYFVSVNTKWNDPLECEYCFPKKSMLNERPLIETNRSSIIPVQMLGIREENILKAEKKTGVNERDTKENQARVEKLGDALVYRHIARNGNHFMFYFELEKYFIQNRKEIIEWLHGLKGQKKKGTGIVYDVIVAPLHYSNAGFLAEVNYHLYGNAALVLNFEVEKEFRENVRTKYSNVTGLYKKLIDMDKPAELRFHFVDDNIITGNTFYRARSLFSSLIPVGQSGKVKVRVFEDIIVLLNRMSEANIMNCVQDRENYHAYVYLNISSMRNHEDACTLCKVVENSMKLRDQSATNRMYEYWDKKMVYHRVEKPEKCRDDFTADAEYRQRAIRRMLCTHRTNQKLGQAGYMQNEADEVRKIMLELLKEKKDAADAMEWVISYIKIFSRPFVSFRKSCQEASFEIMLELTEFMTGELIKKDSEIANRKFTNYKDLKEVCVIIRDALLGQGQGEQVFSLLLTLMQRLSALGSNYVIRRENIRKLFLLTETMIKKSYIPEGKREKFIQKYIGIVKRIVCLSSDENKCIYLEYIILFGEEYRNRAREKEIVKSRPAGIFGRSLLPGEVPPGDAAAFFEILFLENTRVLYDGICDLNREMNTDITLEQLRGQLADKYYFKNFKRLLMYYDFLGKEETVTFKKDCGEAVLAMIRLYRMLSGSEGEQEERDVDVFYNDFLGYVEEITHAQDVSLLIPAVRTDIGRIVYKKQRGTEAEPGDIDFEDETFLYDTYAISEKEDAATRVLIRYRNYVGKEYSGKEKNQMNEVYLELKFPADITRMQRMTAMKCIMTFRDLIVKNLEKDFSNNLMQEWSAERYFKKNMQLERASDHTDKDELADTLKLISQGIEEWSIKHQRALFELVINSYIARFNVQLLADALPEGENIPCRFAYVYKKQLKTLLDTLHGVEEFKIIDENGEECFSDTVLKSQIRMYRDERRCERLSIRRLSIIVVELILSAIKYSDDQNIQIYREKEYLVAKNTFVSEKNIEIIRQEARDAYSRKKDGISLAVIRELVNKFYYLNPKDGVIIDAEEIGERKYYIVKLPIFEEQKEDEADGEGAENFSDRG